jgi:hypothetical protein
LNDQQGSFERGTLVQSLGSRYERHRHDEVPVQDVCPTSIPDSEVASLSFKECAVLDVITSSAARYAVYSTPGKLDWGVGLKVDTVLARLPCRSGCDHDSSCDGKQEEYCTAVIRWIGKLNKHHYGAVLDEHKVNGKHHCGKEITNKHEVNDKHHYGVEIQVRCSHAQYTPILLSLVNGSVLHRTVSIGHNNALLHEWQKNCTVQLY